MLQLDKVEIILIRQNESVDYNPKNKISPYRL